MSRFQISKALVIIGFLIGLISWAFTVGHVGDPEYLLIPAFELGSTHGWYHAFREAAGDLAAMLVILIIFFGSTKLRQPATWVICFILMLGYYAPFWIGMPFNPALAAPNMAAELIHISMAAFSVAGLLLARAEFYRRSEV